MSIFGQVWLWSLVAFVLGALLTWLLLVRPAQSRNRELERRLAAAHAAQSANPTAPDRANRSDGSRMATGVAIAGLGTGGGMLAASAATRSEEDERPSEPDSTRTFDHEQQQPPTRTFESEPEHDRPFEPQRPYYADSEEDDFAVAEQDLDAAAEDDETHEPAWFGQDSRDAQGPPTEHFQPATPPEQQRAPLFDPEGSQNVSSVLEPERRDDVPEETAAESTSIFTPRVEPEPPSYTEPPSYPEPSSYTEPPLPPAPPAPSAPPEVDDETAAETTQLLPKRQPRQSPPGGFEPPRPIQPSMRPIERRGEFPPGQEGAQSGSLFEPAIRRNQSMPVEQPGTPPARPQERSSEGAIPPGPFGPGSAMPRPGGGRPSEEFGVKASVTALRYCTEESPQFPRMVAEVWFRTAADAERVGFRPLD